MTNSGLGGFASEIASLTQMLGGRSDHARFLFDDLVTEAGYTARNFQTPYCRALRAALIAFQVEFTQSRDAALAHTAACARLEVLAMLPGRS